ncbi:MAG TPA: hypothetical protein VFO27_13170 [Bryobacteraceae bacterium]|nr:hypothetical protein [Bryobacteraceae bacterium]
MGCQFHPEFKSKPMEPHPLFRSFIGASHEHRHKRLSARRSGALEEVREYSRRD